jgi:rSAM/selenodomain-associated transferase 2
MISIIIPSYNEVSSIEKTLVHLNSIDRHLHKEIIVVDGGSNDATAEIAQKHANLIRSPKGRAKQLNYGAKAAKGDILFFVHADMFVPESALTAINKMISERYDGGAFRNEFDQHNKKIKRLGRILNLRIKNTEQSDQCIFYGDNGIFVKKEAFEKLNGFKDIPIMEDYDFSMRMRKNYRVKRIDTPCIIVSARRHISSGFIKTRLLWIIIRKLYQLGVSPFKLAKWYADVR